MWAVFALLSALFAALTGILAKLKEKLYAIVKEIHSARFPYNDFLYNTEAKEF